MAEQSASIRLSGEHKGRKRREAVWIGRHRIVGKDSARALGKAWTKRSRAAEGYMTRSEAEKALRRLLASEAATVKASEGMTFGQSARHPAPVVQLSLLRDRVFSSANGAVLLAFAAFSMVLLSVILWLQGHWHYSAITTGLASAPGPAVVPIFAAIAQNLQQKTKIPVGAIAALGQLLMGLGVILFALSLGDTPDYVDAFLPGWLTVGAGAGLAIPTLFSSATVNLAPQQTATGSAIVSMFQQIGAVIGISVLVAILGIASGAASLHLFQAAWITAAALTAGALIVAFGITPRRTAPSLASVDRDVEPEAQPASA